MLRFEDPTYLYLLLAVPVMAMIRLVVWQLKKRKLHAFGDIELLKQLMPDMSRYRPTVKFWLLLAAYAILVVMLARPQMGSKISREKRNGIEAIICMDIFHRMWYQAVLTSRRCL